ncbi:hypothetical protein [Amycolatopsis magusensis]|uniref:Uncharacterized protein n=1 Tax=Amycolatopsis magusensis TaxID=882444 RepID=A0ABS4PNQ2_9PSEU|nr:hypothetical protein [Amycolatopsis magusensis]MBP2181022.1 hypothetical protein [Amycolatopsis magusensis]MDI5980854.1 hypothetical protein [Amycolatopsis magusensis]UJW33046.1 hypothetical protein L3Q67_04435 [Saccharothrix sp. AJ9571]
MDKLNVVELPREDNVVLVIDRFDQWHNQAGLALVPTQCWTSGNPTTTFPEAA